MIGSGRLTMGRVASKTPASGSVGDDNIATRKFNFLAWCARKSFGDKFEPANGLVDLTGARTGCSPPGCQAHHRRADAGRPDWMRQIIGAPVGKRLAAGGLIGIVERPGKSSEYRFKLDGAPANWIKSETERYIGEKAAHNPSKILEPSKSCAGSKSPEGAKSLEGTQLRSERGPSQNLSAVNIRVRKHCCKPFRLVGKPLRRCR